MAPPIPVRWTDFEDHALRELRSRAVPWSDISALFDRPVSTCMDRARIIGARRPACQPPPERPWVSDDRLPLPPGHPVTWGLLTRGTCLEGVPYER